MDVAIIDIIFRWILLNLQYQVKVGFTEFGIIKAT
jgi:hypothetical protein